jgi:hypothetical protein
MYNTTKITVNRRTSIKQPRLSRKMLKVQTNTTGNGNRADHVSQSTLLSYTIFLNWKFYNDFTINSKVRAHQS